MKQKRDNRSPRGGNMKRVTQLVAALLCAALLTQCLDSDNDSDNDHNGPAPIGPGSFIQAPGLMTEARAAYAVAVLATGEVLVVGGCTNPECFAVSSAELYDPESGDFAVSDIQMSTSRFRPTATLLPTGKVLVAGGRSEDADFNVEVLDSAELYDPETGRFAAAGSPMTAKRYIHTATRLNDGRVLIAGGADGEGGVHASAEIYDPDTDTFTPTAGPMSSPRFAHRAVLLRDGKVLLVGGDDGASFLTTAEVYEPASGTFSVIDGVPGQFPSATLLADGRVLVAGGAIEGQTLATAAIYDPATESFTASQGTMSSARFLHFATLLPSGKVLVGGGFHSFTFQDSGPEADLYDPESDTFTPTARPLNIARGDVSSAPLPEGKVLISGGSDRAGLPLTSGEVYDPEQDGFAVTGGLNSSRIDHTATRLQSGEVLLTGGVSDASELERHALASAEVLDPSDERFTPTATPMAVERVDHTATLLDDGKVLIAGGSFEDSRAELYDPADRTFTPTAGAMGTVRIAHTASRLADGTVLLAGGAGQGGLVLTSAELYDPSADVFTPVSGQLTTARVAHTAALLGDGRVLIAGGSSGGGTVQEAVASAEVFDPATGAFTPTGSEMASKRVQHTAVTLADGRVLIAGGRDENETPLASAEVYDPATDRFEAVEGGMLGARYGHSAVLLESGAVLLAGGYDETGTLASAELYNPRTGSFVEATPMTRDRAYHRATLLGSGEVLISGGEFLTGGTAWQLETAEIFTP
jgi:hypothetical protein